MATTWASATAYGGVKTSTGKYDGIKFRSWVDVSVTSDNKQYTVTVKYGIMTSSETTGYVSNSGCSYNLSNTDGTLVSVNDAWQYQNNSSGTNTVNTNKKQISYRTWSWTRGTTDTIKTITFKAWNDYNSNCKWGSSSSPSTATYTITVKAKPKYTVVYNANGGTGAPASQTKWYDTALKLQTGIPSRQGYTFTHWMYDSNSYQPGATLSKNINKNITLMAQWEPIIYNITYDSNGANAGTVPESTTAAFGSAYTVENGLNLIKSHYSLIKQNENIVYNTKPDGSGARYIAGTTYTINDNLTLYVEWTPDRYEINYKDDNSVIETAEWIYGTDFFINNTKNPIKNYYNLDGWTYNGTKYMSGDRFNANLDNIENGHKFELQANWKPNELKITFSFGGEGNQATKTYIYGPNPPSNPDSTIGCYIKIPFTSPIEKFGYKVNGWKRTGPERIYQPGVSGETDATLNWEGNVSGFEDFYYSLQQNAITLLTLTAIISPKEYIIEFKRIEDGQTEPDHREWSGEMNPQTFTFDVAENLELNSFTRKGWKFTGWEMEDNEILFADGELIDGSFLDQSSSFPSQNIKFIAQWEQIESDPGIENVTNFRCDGNGVEDDTGTLILSTIEIKPGEKYNEDTGVTDYSVPTKYEIIIKNILEENNTTSDLDVTFIKENDGWNSSDNLNRMISTPPTEATGNFFITILVGKILNEDNVECSIIDLNSNYDYEVSIFKTKETEETEETEEDSEYIKVFTKGDEISKTTFILDISPNNSKIKMGFNTSINDTIMNQNGIYLGKVNDLFMILDEDSSSGNEEVIDFNLITELNNAFWGEPVLFDIERSGE